MKHIMLDLETMGKRAGCPIVQLSAVEFDLDGNIGREFDARIKLDNQSSLGFELDSSTVLWWLRQSKDAQNIVFGSNDTRSILDVLPRFSEWMNSVREGKENDICLWGNGISFDNMILEEAYKICSIPVPFTFREYRDVRTIVELDDSLIKEDIKNTQNFIGVKHNAIDDCKHQIKYIVRIIKRMMGGNGYDLL